MTTAPSAQAEKATAEMPRTTDKSGMIEERMACGVSQDRESRNLIRLPALVR